MKNGVIFRTIAQEQAIENKIIRRVLARAQEAGYTLIATVASYEVSDRVNTPTAEDVIRIFRTQDADSYVRLAPPAASVGMKRAWIRFIGGNGEDVFADYSDSLRPIFEDFDPSETGDAEMGEGA